MEHPKVGNSYVAIMDHASAMKGTVYIVASVRDNVITFTDNEPWYWGPDGEPDFKDIFTEYKEHSFDKLYLTLKS